MRTVFTKITFLLLWAIAPAMIAKAASESYIQMLTGKLKPGDSCVVVDDKFLHLSLEDWNQIRQLSVNNIITFELRHDTAIFYYKKPFTCTLNISIKYFTSRDQQTPDEINNVDLVVKYDTASGKFYPAESNYKFKNAFKVVVVINSITSSEWGNQIPAIFRLKNQILVERKYPFKAQVDAALSLIEIQAAPQAIQPTGGYSMQAVDIGVDPVKKQLSVTWNPVDFGNPDEYDVEWTYIDEASLRAGQVNVFLNVLHSNIPPAEVELWMRNDATRVTVGVNSYTINLAYDPGYILFRVRGVSYDATTNVRLQSNWVFTKSDNKTSIYLFTGGHEANLNWQFTAAFAEEGKRKEVISYFDGSLRSRQQVTINNTDGKAIVQESIYDNMGRPSLNFLPAPAADETLKFYGAFNTNASGIPFSNTDIGINSGNPCKLQTSIASSSTGAANYYSPSNPLLGNQLYYFTSYLPDAEQYPFSVVEYTPDNTGRIRNQGGVGWDFQIGNKRNAADPDHFTKYFYGKPFQEDLDRIFGVEVGKASHYQKNLVVDANGQASVSYVDANGKTIATALAGNAPANLDILPSAQSPDAHTTRVNTLIQTPDFKLDASSLKLEATATFLAPVPTGTYTLYYSFEKLSIQTLHGPNNQPFCSNCYYVVTVDVRNDCGDLVAHGEPPPFVLNDVICHNQQIITTPLGIPINKVGEYTVTYTLQLAKDQIDFHVDYYIKNNKDLRTLQDFFQDELDKLDLNACYNDCATCKTLGSNVSGFRAKILALLGNGSFVDITDNQWIDDWIDRKWHELKDRCDGITCEVTSPCEPYLLQMKEDVKPGGQYAQYVQDNVTGLFSYTERTINVLRFYNDPSIPDLIFEDENGNPLHRNALSESDFIKYYLVHPEWADDFVTKHIEYCSYLWCKNQNILHPEVSNEKSYGFDRTLSEMVTTGAEATARGYFDPTDPYKLLNRDPFFQQYGRGEGRYNAMHNDLQHFSTAIKLVPTDFFHNPLPDKNILQLVDWYLYCKPTSSNPTAQEMENSWNNCVPDNNCRTRTREWEMYRDYYLQIKSKYLRLEKIAYNPSCTDCFIGTDLLGETVCTPPGPLQDYSFTVENAGPDHDHYLVYKNGTESFQGRYKITYQYNLNGVSSGNQTVEVQKGQDRMFLVGATGTENHTNFVLISIECISTTIQNCAPTGGGCSYTTNDFHDDSYNPSGGDNNGVYQEYSDYYLTYSSGTVTQDVEVNYEIVKTYEDGHQETESSGSNPAIFHAGDHQVFIGSFVSYGFSQLGGQPWVWTRTQIIPVLVNCNNSNPATSTCINDPRHPLYANKVRIFNDFVDFDSWLNCIANNIPPGTTEERALAAVRQQAISELTALRENWRDRLKSVRDEENENDIANGVPQRFGAITDGQIESIINQCYNLSLDYINSRTYAQINDIHPVSTVPSGNPASFATIFVNVLSTTITQNGFNEYLLDIPFPHDKTPFDVNLIVSETSTDICSNLATFKSRYLSAVSSGYAGTFYDYLKKELGDDMIMTEAQLTDLDNRCIASCRYLEEPINLPVALSPKLNNNPDHPSVICTRINGLIASFATAYPSIDQTSKLYRLSLTNYINHAIGFGLSYTEYMDFKTQCTSEPTAILYNKPRTPNIIIDDFLCTAEAIKSAYTTAGQEYDFYIAVERKRFMNLYVSTCLGNKAKADIQSDQFEYHYTLYYYDQSGNLVKTIPPEGVRFLSEQEIQLIKQYRDANPAQCDGTGIPTTEDKTGTLNSISSYLQNVQNPGRSMEMWLYSNNGTSTRQVRFVTPDNKFFYQAAIKDDKVWVELYSLTPNANGELEITLSNHAVGDAYGITIQAWSHLVAQSPDLPGQPFDLFLDGRRLTIIPPANAPPYPFDWEIVGGFTLPTEDFSQVKHLRLYNEVSTDAQILENYKNSCLSPVAPLIAPRLLVWGRFNIPAPGSETTIGPGSTVEVTNHWIVPKHGLPSTYEYNSLNQVVKQTSPDAGTSEFWYDLLSRLVISQNAEQKNSPNVFPFITKFSYTKLDVLGRTVEVGEKWGSPIQVDESLAKTNLNNFYSSASDVTVTATFYDAPPPFVTSGVIQRNLRKRVSATAYLHGGVSGYNSSRDNISYYSYDITGNVEELTQQIGEVFFNESTFVTNADGYKRIKYEYDLISGKVNKVLYQQGKYDQFFYHYKYDKDNRLEVVETSRDNLIWTREAAYRYYIHGPLARMELGRENNQVQGLDYAYTLQGWLKGVNGQQLDPDKQMTPDGKPATAFSDVSRDVIAFSLGYFGNDYHPIGTTNAPAFGLNYTSSLNDPSGKELFNGNIRNATFAIGLLDNGTPAGYTYRYDQLSRLTAMNRHIIGAGVTAWGASNIIQDYAERISYDGNGNILTYQRNGTSAVIPNNNGGIGMDNLVYNYERDAHGNLLSNKLQYIDDDPLLTPNYSQGILDIDDQSPGNYRYDKNGNLLADQGGSLHGVEWNPYGKIWHLWGAQGPMRFDYDAIGSRVVKELESPSNHGKTYYYVRDTHGNPLAVYVHSENGSSPATWEWKEQHLYGESRLGMLTPGLQIFSNNPLPDDDYVASNDHTQDIGRRQYELSNHLGSVLTVIDDTRTGVDLNGDNQTDYFVANALSAQDYYPSGMMMPGRTSATSNQYRFGFSGRETDDEIRGKGNSYNFDARLYDPRIARWFSTDIKGKPQISPYNFVQNNFPNNIDPDGNDDIHFHFIRQRVPLYGLGGAVCTSGVARSYTVVSTAVVVIIKTNQPDRFYHHKTFISEHGDVRDKVTEFFPFIASSRSGLTTTEMPFSMGLINRDDRDIHTLAKYYDASPAFKDYLDQRMEEPKFKFSENYRNYRDLFFPNRSHYNTWSKVTKISETTADILMLAEGGLALLARGPSGGLSVYRSIRPDEAASINAGKGITAKNPLGAWTLEEHLIKGSGKPSWANDPWIATSSDPAIARSFGSGNGFIKIDLTKLPSSTSVERGWMNLPRSSLGYHYSIWEQEYSIFRHVPQEAITVIK